MTTDLQSRLDNLEQQTNEAGARLAEIRRRLIEMPAAEREQVFERVAELSETDCL